MARPKAGEIDPGEAEYQAALTVYRAARRQLDMAKKARPPYLPYQRAARMREQIWEAYLAGQHEFKELAKQFNISTGHARATVKGEMHMRRFGPPSPYESEMLLILRWIDESFRNKNVASLDIARIRKNGAE